jgi:drug/metabolite transporter (DMT)-like permease
MQKAGRDVAEDAIPVAPRAVPAIDVRAFVYVALMVVLGSTTAAAAKIAVRELPISLLPILRFGVAGLCVLPLIGGRGQLTRLFREDGLGLVLVAALCVPVNQGFFLSASRLGPTSHVGIFYATAPLVVLLGAWALRLERPDRARLWGVLASVSGIAVIGVGNLWDGGKGAATDVRSVAVGDLLLVGAVLSWGAYITLSKPLIVKHGALPVLAGTFLAGSALTMPAALWTMPGWPPAHQISMSSWLALGYLSLIVTPLGQACQNLALHRLDASQVATYSNASPLLTVIWGLWLFDELLTPALVVGGALTLGGLFWTSRQRRGSRPRHPDSATLEAVPRPPSERAPRLPGQAAPNFAASVPASWSVDSPGLASDKTQIAAAPRTCRAD